MQTPATSETLRDLYSHDGLLVPFNSRLLDELMEQAGIDVVLATSKHNSQYLLGGHRFFFFGQSDAIGLSRYLPVVVYPRTDPGGSAYVGYCIEDDQTTVEPLWIPTVENSSTGTQDAIVAAARHAARSRNGPITIGIEPAFLPADARDWLQNELPHARLTDATTVLERLRARKTPSEVELMRRVAESIARSILDAVAEHGEGSTKREIAESVRQAQTRRGLNFDHCLISAGADPNRAPSEQEWRLGETLSLDSAGDLGGYIGDIARMAVLGQPDALLEDLLEQVDAVQMAARSVVRVGTAGREIYAAASEALAEIPMRESTLFVAHGIGLINHEAPRLTDSGPVPYPASHADIPLEEGMVISIETTLVHPARGFIKLEDEVVVTPDGCEALGDTGRGWNVQLGRSEK
jgi:Xaa-Pro aminopeptidase